MSILEVNVETGQEKLLLKPNWYFIQQFEWLPNGDGLLVCGRDSKTSNSQIWRMSYPDGALQKLTNDDHHYLSFSLSADASEMIAVHSTLASHIWVSPNINGSKAKNVADGRGRAAWTSDGRIIYNSASVMGSDLWIAKPDGTDPKQLSFNSGTNDWPALSPDGRTIVFESDRTGIQHLWRMDLDGNNQVQLTNGEAERNATVSPDGKWIYYNSSENNFLWKVASGGGEPVQLTDEYAGYPSISPDGKLIACFHFPRYAHEARITVRSTENMKTVAELTLAPGFWISRSIQWDADNSTMIYAIQTKEKVKLYRQSLNSRPPQELTALKAEDEFEFALSPNHKQFAFISSKWNHDAVLIDGLK
jgi:Tol biopolymer transport system component